MKFRIRNKLTKFVFVMINVICLIVTIPIFASTANASSTFSTYDYYDTGQYSGWWKGKTAIKVDMSESYLIHGVRWQFDGGSIPYHTTWDMDEGKDIWSSEFVKTVGPGWNKKVTFYVKLNPSGSLNENGAYSFQVAGSDNLTAETDSAGTTKWKGWQSTTVYIDAQKPCTANTSSNNGAWTGAIDITSVGEDNQSGLASMVLYYSIDNNTWLPINSAPYSGTQDQQSFNTTISNNGYYKTVVTDRVGYSTTSGVLNVTNIDTTTPTVSVSDISTSWCTSDPVTISFNDSQSGITGYTVTTSNTVPANWTAATNGSVTWTPTTNGTYYAWVKDGAGRVASSAFNINRIDDAVPSVSVSDISTTWAQTDDIKLSLSDSQSGVSGYAVTTSNTIPSNWVGATNGTVTWTATTNGTYYAWVKDNVGRTSSSSFTINKVDDTAPKVIVSDISTTWAQTDDIKLSLSDSQSGVSGYAVTTSNSVPPNWTNSSNGTVTWTATANGIYYAWVKDNVGRTSSQEFKVSYVDTTPPVVELDIDTAICNDWYLDDVLLKFSSTDTQSGVKEISVNGKTNQNVTWEITDNEDGTKTYTYFATDNAGNSSTPVEKTIKLDRVYPLEYNLDADVNKQHTSAELNLETKDLESGLYDVTLQNSLDCNSWETIKKYEELNSVATLKEKYTVNQNGYYRLIINDVAGHEVTTEPFFLNKLDDKAPDVTIIPNTTKWVSSKKGVNINTIFSDNSGGIVTDSVIYSTNNGETWSELYSKNYDKPVENDAFNYTFYDNVLVRANVSDDINDNSSDLTIANIDSQDPIIQITPSIEATKYETAENGYDLNISTNDSQSGVATVKLYKDEQLIKTIDKGDTLYHITENGTYKVVCEDNATRTSSKTIEIKNIISKGPVLLSIVPKTTDWVMSETGLALTISATDINSGVETMQLSLVTSDTEEEVIGTFDNKENKKGIFTDTIVVNRNGWYKLKATNKAGIVSEVYYNITNIDYTVPDALLELKYEREPGNSYVTSEGAYLSATASDNESSLSTVTIMLDGKILDSFNLQKITQDTKKYPLSQNGNYQFIYENVAGGTKTVELAVNCIDTQAPLLKPSFSKELVSSKNGLQLIVTTQDDLSGLENIVVTDSLNNVIATDTTFTKGSTDELQFDYFINKNDTYTIATTDYAGNTSTDNIVISNVESQTPALLISGIPTKWTNKPCNITITAVKSLAELDSMYINSKSVELNNKEVATHDLIVSENSNSSVVVNDAVNNTATTDFDVNYIDTASPQVEVTKSEWTDNGFVIDFVSSDALSGLASVQINGVEMLKNNKPNEVISITPTEIPTVQSSQSSSNRTPTDASNSVSNNTVTAVQTGLENYTGNATYSMSGEYSIKCTDLAGNVTKQVVSAPLKKNVTVIPGEMVTANPYKDKQETTPTYTDATTKNDTISPAETEDAPEANTSKDTSVKDKLTDIVTIIFTKLNITTTEVTPIEVAENINEVKKITPKEIQPTDNIETITPTSIEPNSEKVSVYELSRADTSIYKNIKKPSFWLSILGAIAILLIGLAITIRFLLFVIPIGYIYNYNCKKGDYSFVGLVLLHKIADENSIYFNLSKRLQKPTYTSDFKIILNKMAQNNCDTKTKFKLYPNKHNTDEYYVTTMENDLSLNFEVTFLNNIKK